MGGGESWTVLGMERKVLVPTASRFVLDGIIQKGSDWLRIASSIDIQFYRLINTDKLVLPC